MKNLTENPFLAELLDEFPAYISIHDTDYRIRWMNRASCDHRGKSLEDIEGLKCYFLKGYSRPCRNCPVEEVFRTGLPSENEVLLDEDVRPLEDSNSWVVKASPIRNRDGNVIGAVSIAEDVTEYRKTELRLKKEQEFVKDIIDASRDLIWASDSEGRLTYSNTALEKILGYSPGEIKGRLFAEFMHPEDHERFKKFLPGMVRAKRGWKSQVVRWKHKDGSWKEMESNAVPILDAEGRAAGFRGVDRDVTERNQLTAQLLHAQKLEAVGRLAGGIAHDFNNMIGVILGYSEIVLDQMDPSIEIEEALLEIQNAASRSAALTRQLLAFARKQEVAPEVLDLNATVDGMLKMLERLIGEEISLSWVPGDDLWKVKMDSSQLDQVLANLCVNARDAIRGRGTITIKTSNSRINSESCLGCPGLAPGYYVALEITDSGHGIDKEIIDTIFEPFFTTKSKGEGTGLGLPIVYGIVKQNNGFIYVFSEPGEFTTFRILLPRCERGNESE